MLIDFHTHIFPDRIASAAFNKMRERIVQLNYIDKPYEEAFPLCTDGTLSGLRASMKRSGVDLSIVLPIATHEGQTDSINNFAEEIRSGDVISFGSLHPFQKNWEYVLCDLAERGFRGIKFHPEFQQFYIDGKESLRIFKKAEQLGLLVVFHAGHDPEYVGQDHATPIRLKHVLEEVEGSNIIAAHLGGMECWDDVEKYIVGSPVTFDISYVSKMMDMEQYKRIIIKHGVDKVVFGSDSPWQDPSETYEALKGIGLDKESLDKITYKNAINLLENK